MSRLTIISCLMCAYVAVCNARAQGYRPSGWRPSNAELALPGEYGAPPVPTPSPTSTVQTTKENVEFAGQTVEITSQNANYAYAPVHNQFQQIKSTKSPNEEYLPRRTPPQPFRPTSNTNETVVFPESAQLRIPVFVQSSRLQYNPNAAIFSVTQQLPQFQQIRLFNANDRAQDKQQQQQQLLLQQQQQQQQQVQQQNYPYPPAQVDGNVDERTADADVDIDDSEATTEEPTKATVANASGQYYILGTDNTLQRVMYAAGQTEDDIINNGFTAQLRYSPVEPIRDPVYGYDDQGQLVRIFNRK